MTENKKEQYSNTGRWVKLRHDRRMAGEGVSCRVLLASDYKRGAYSKADWGDFGACDEVIFHARNKVADKIFDALPPEVLESMKKPMSRGGYAIEPNVCGRVNTKSETTIDWEITYGSMRLVAGTCEWVERALEEAKGDEKLVAQEIARIAVEESGILTYLAKQYPESNQTESN